jgi:pentose-5-phosphate-3-epimerase
MHTIPTLLTTNIEEFVTQMNIFQKYYKRIQLDIADGILVPNKTTQIEEMIDIFLQNKELLDIKVEFDFHLMVSDFKKELNKIQKLQELGMKVNIALINAQHSFNIEELNTEYIFNIGLDIFPDTTVKQIESQYDLDQISTIQVMTVQPGFQGSPFLEHMLLKIEQLRISNYKSIIMIDGGVNEVTIPLIKSKKYIPDFICVGSYLTKAEEQFEERVQKLNNL